MSVTALLEMRSSSVPRSTLLPLTVEGKSVASSRALSMGSLMVQVKPLIVPAVHCCARRTVGSKSTST
eukprot:74063-Prymnesium_polylepis.1